MTELGYKVFRDKYSIGNDGIKLAHKVPFIVFHCSNCGVTLPKYEDICSKCGCQIVGVSHV